MPFKKGPDNQNQLQTFLNHLYELDYKERPVTVDEFLDSPCFLGKLLNNGKAVRPIWREELNRIMADDRHWQIVLTGAIGTGKSRAAIWGILYVMHRILCLKDPWKYFGGKAAGGKMTVAFFNLVKSQAQSKGLSLAEAHLTTSPWFLERGTLGGSDVNPVLHLPLFELKLATPYSHGFGIQGDDVIIGILDEMDAPDESVGQKKKVIDAYESTVNRFKTRFVFDEESLGRLFLVASKQEQLSFLNAFATEHQNDPDVRTVDIPLWRALPKEHYSGRTFKVALGDIYIPSEIIESPEAEIQALRSGRRLIEVPVEHHSDFKRNITKALRDIAGIADSAIRKSKLFVSDKVLTDCYDSQRRNPINQNVIEIGFRDDIDLAKFIDFSAIRVPPNIPRCIHWDLSLTKDATGIGMSGVSGWKKLYKEDATGVPITQKVPVIETDFGMRLKARKGDQIPFNKIRKLIIDLKMVYGYNIIMVTADLNLMSADSRQTLALAGLNTDHFSMDKNPELYRAFCQQAGDGQWVAPFIPMLHFELVNLEDDPKRNKIDHPAKVEQVVLLPNGGAETVVLEGSKDLADGVVGSVEKALELCKAPPDIEIMSRLMEQALKPSTSQYIDPNQELMNLMTETGKNEEGEKKHTAPTSKEMQIFQGIMRKAQGL